MNLRAIKILSCAASLCATLLSSCGGVTPIPELAQTEIPNSIASPISTPTIQAINNTETIQPENVSQLGIIDEWGQGNVYGVALSPDEKTIAVATTTGVYLYDSKTSEQKQFIDLPIIRKTKRDFSPSRAVAFSPDGNLLAVGYDDIMIWDLKKNDYYGWVDNRIADFNAVQVAFAPQGNTIVVMSMGMYAPCDAWGGNFALYDISSRAILYNDYFCPESALFHFTFTNDENVAFAGIIRDSSDWGYKISIVNTTTGALIKRLNFSGLVDSISPDGSKVSVRQYPYSTEIIDTKTQKVIDSIEGLVIFLPDGQKQLVANDKGWTITTSDHEVICDFKSKPRLILDVYRSTFTLAGNNLVFWDGSSQKVEIWDTSDCQLSTQLSIPIIGFNSFKYSKNGNILVTNSWSSIHVQEGKTGSYKFSISGMFNHLPSQFYDLSADGKTIVSVSDTKPYTIAFWDTTSGKEVKSIPTTLENIQYVFINPDGDVVATLDYGGIHLWDVENSNLLTIIPGRFGRIYFNPKGNNFAIVNGNSIILRNFRSGEIEKSISFAKGQFSVVFSNDWSYLAFVGDDKIELWNIDGGKIREFMEYPPIKTNIDPTRLYDMTFGTKAEHYDVKFSPNNNLLAAIRYDSNNYSVRFWDTSTGKIVRDIIIPFRISGLEFSPDGKSITLLGDGIIYVMGLVNPK